MTHHLTKLFALLEDGAIVPIAQPIYASLVRREIAMLEYASRCIRIADWYVGYEGDHAVSVDNETYQILWFDEAGRAWPEAAPGCDRHGGACMLSTHRASPVRMDIDGIRERVAVARSRINPRQ